MDRHAALTTSSPVRVGAVVFLVVAMVVSGSLWVETLAVDGSSDAGLQFEEVGAQRGIDYEGTADKRAAFGNGRAGVYVLDFNRDGWPDLLTIGGERPALYENMGGTFERRSLPDVDIDLKSALVFDYDADGWEEVLLIPIDGEPIMLENDEGTFSVQDVGFNHTIDIGMAATAGDYNGDGCLDVFIAQNGDWRSGPPLAVRIATIEEDYGRETTQSLRDSPDNGNPNFLYQGDCSEFERVTDTGINGTKWSVATSMVDLTGDGLPDIHVANDFNNDTLYVNRGDGNFRQETLPETDRNGMSSEVTDVNRDGRLDVFVTNIHFERKPHTMRVLPGMSNEGNNLLINRGNGTFTSEEDAYGVMAGEWGWASAFVDFDNDRGRDLIHTTRDYVFTSGGDERQTAPRLWERTGPRNFTDRNASDAGFVESNGKGLAHLDFDLDGDQDVLVADSDGRFKLYENLERDGDGSGGTCLQVLPMTTDRLMAHGATVSVTADGETRTAVANAKSDFLSQDTRVLHFGLGTNETATVTVTWPDGRSHTAELDANQRVRITPDGSVHRVDPAENGTG